MPHAIKTLDKYNGQGLHILLVESQGHTRDEIVPFMTHIWNGKVPMGVLGTSSPFNAPGNGLPATALVGVDGSIVWIGNGGAGCEKVLDEQLGKLHQVKPLEGPLKSLAKDLNARNFGKAIGVARAAAEKPANDKVKDSATGMVEHLTKVVDARFAMAKRLTEAGRAKKAQDLLKQLSKQVAGDKDWTARAAEALKSLEADHKDEIALDKIVCDAEDLLKDKGTRPDAAKKLGDVVKKASGSKLGKYAEELKKAAENKPSLR